MRGRRARSFGGEAGLQALLSLEGGSVLESRRDG